MSLGISSADPGISSLGPGGGIMARILRWSTEKFNSELHHESSRLRRPLAAVKIIENSKAGSSTYLFAYLNHPRLSQLCRRTYLHCERINAS